MIQTVDDGLYKIICGWWDAHGWPCIPRNMLPKSGYVSFCNGAPVIAGFLYKDDSSDFGMVEWIVASPSMCNESRSVGFNELISHIENEARSKGVRLLFTSVNNKSLQGRYAENGFSVSDTGMTNMVRYL